MKTPHVEICICSSLVKDPNSWLQVPKPQILCISDASLLPLILLLQCGIHGLGLSC